MVSGLFEISLTDVQRQSHLDCVIDSFRHAELTAFHDQITNRTATRKLIGNKVQPILAAGIKHAGDVVVIQLRTGAGFVAKARDHGIVLRRSGVQNLQRHITGQLQIQRTKHSPHAPGTQTLTNLKMRQPDPRLIASRRTIRREQTLPQRIRLHSGRNVSAGLHS